MDERGGKEENRGKEEGMEKGEGVGTRMRHSEVILHFLIYRGDKAPEHNDSRSKLRAESI